MGYKIGNVPHGLSISKKCINKKSGIKFLEVSAKYSDNPSLTDHRLRIR